MSAAWATPFCCILVIALISTQAFAAEDTRDCSNQRIVKYYRTDDCIGWFMCVLGKAQRMQDCPDGLVFSLKAHSCVRPGSHFDGCKPATTKPSMCAEDPCLNGATCTYTADVGTYKCECAPLFTDTSCETVTGKCTGHRDYTIIPNEDNCTGWYMCVHGRAAIMSDCGQGMVFSREGNTCVHRGVAWDDCKSPVR